MAIKPYKEAVRNLQNQDFNLAAIYIGNRENAVIKRSQFREHGIETKYAKTIKKEGSKTLAYNFVKFGLKSIGISEYQVYMLKD